MRDLSTDFLAEIEKPALCPVMLCTFHFDSYSLRFWSGIGDLTWDGNAFTGAGHLLALSEMTETQGVEANGMQFTLSGLPSSLISLALDEPYQGRVCEVHIAAIDALSSALIGDPYRVFSGFMDVMEISESGEMASITLTAENRLVILKKAKVYRYTPQEQRRRFPGDKGMDFVPALQDKEIIWGRTAK